MYEVIVIKEGYSCKDEGDGVPSMKAGCSITLLKGPKIILVDTGSAWDRQVVVEGLKKNGVSCDSVNYVVCTHGHSDHVGNLNLFTNAVQIVSYDICFGDQYILHSFQQGIPYEIDNYVEIVPTPGHTGSDVTVLVKGTDHGTLAVAGDLFECEEDMENPHLWQDNSENEELQEQSRINILQVADTIIPGHGRMFRVPKDKSSMRVVMFYEERMVAGQGHSSRSSSEYVVIEQE